MDKYTSLAQTLVLLSAGLLSVKSSQSDLHDLMQRLIAGSQFGHGKCGGDTNGGHEDVGLGGPAENQLFV